MPFGQTTHPLDVSKQLTRTKIIHTLFPAETKMKNRPAKILTIIHEHQPKVRKTDMTE